MRCRHAGDFWDRVNQTGGPTSCWPINPPYDLRGYGTVQLGLVRRGHRVAWSLVNGPIPKGMRVLHRCDNPPCCNPDHLFLGTDLDNIRDMWAKGRAVVHHGEQIHTSRLGASQIAEIRTATGRSRRDLARQYRVSHQTITQILLRQTWAHLG